MLTTSRYNNLIIFLYRPSPQIPEPSVEATLICYNSATRNVALQKRMYDNHSVDVTFVFIYQISMTITTLIWCCCSAVIRKVHKKETIKAYLDTGISVLSGLAHKWPGTEAAVDVYQKLAKAALSSYDEDEKRKKQATPPLSTADTSPNRPVNEATTSKYSPSQSGATSTLSTQAQVSPTTSPAHSSSNKGSPDKSQNKQQHREQSHPDYHNTSPTRPHISTPLPASTIGHIHQSAPEIQFGAVALQDLQQIMWNQVQNQYGVPQEFDPFGWNTPHPTQLKTHVPPPQQRDQWAPSEAYQEYYLTPQPQDILRQQQQQMAQQRQQEWRNHQEQQRELMIILENEAQLRYEQQQMGSGWASDYQVTAG